MWKGKESDSPWQNVMGFGEVAPGTNLAREVGNHVPQMVQYLEAMVHNSRRNNIGPQRTYQVNEMLERFFFYTNTESIWVTRSKCAKENERL